MWSQSQMERLAVEEKLVQRYFGDFSFYDRTGDTYIEGWVTTNMGNSYKLKIEIPSHYPYECPELFVVSPHTLWMYGGTDTINAQGTSHDFHVRDNGPDGCVKICHVRDWHASLTCTKVLTMGVLWLAAYEGHLRTGKDIADYLLG